MNFWFFFRSCRYIGAVSAAGLRGQPVPGGKKCSGKKKRGKKKFRHDVDFMMVYIMMISFISFIFSLLKKISMEEY